MHITSHNLAVSLLSQRTQKTFHFLNAPMTNIYRKLTRAYGRLVSH